jgi:hypothetical protein
MANDDGSTDPVYMHKPSLMGAAWEYRLRPNAIEWRMGRHEGRVSYRAIRRVRLSFLPVTLQSRRFVTEVWSADGPKLTIASTSWRSIMEQATQDESYGAFVRELHRRLAAAGSEAAFDAGSPALLYWPGVAVFVAAGLALAGVTVHALTTGAWTGAALVAGFLALFLWQSGPFFLRNWPGRYRPEAVPDHLVPGG